MACIYSSATIYTGDNSICLKKSICLEYNFYTMKRLGLALLGIFKEKSTQKLSYTISICNTWSFSSILLLINITRLIIDFSIFFFITSSTATTICHEVPWFQFLCSETTSWNTSSSRARGVDVHGIFYYNFLFIKS